jgi:FkbM family methyltransferase
MQNQVIKIIDDVEGQIRFIIENPVDKTYTMYARDVATGLLRGKTEIDCRTKSPQGHWVWWNPHPGTGQSKRKNLGDIIIEIKDGDQMIQTEYVYRHGPGKKLIVKDKEVRYPGNLTDIYPTVWEIFFVDDYYTEFLDIHKGGIVVDIGFNYGIFSLYAIDNFDPKKIYAVEPMPSCVKIGKRILNEQSVLFDITEGAITLENSTVFMDNYENQSNCATVVGSNVQTTYFLESDQIPVKGININDYLATIPEKEIELMKIDCEGGEEFIFDTISSANLRRVKNYIIEYHSADIRLKVINALNSERYSVYQKPSWNNHIGTIEAYKKY